MRLISQLIKSISTPFVLLSSEVFLVTFPLALNYSESVKLSIGSSI